MKQTMLVMIAILTMGSMCRAQEQTRLSGNEQQPTDSTSLAKAKSDVEFHLDGDFVTSYIWRGMKLGAVSLQPEMSVSWKGLSLSAWGSVGLSDKDDPSEIDLTLSYETGGLTFGVVDYWNDEDEKEKRFFYYNKDHTGHVFEGFVEYDFGPVCASWQTMFAGRDFRKDDGKREYSSYFELSAPFAFADCDWEATVGVVPWKTEYYEVSGFSVTNVGLRATKTLQIAKDFALPLFGELTANPASQQMYFVFGFTLKAL